ncbi:hypothetical protein K432DRAFT_11936 [Lepidopterella palustris CBS 459.81]|uniref:Uncharacterized protein n=1 Tax=Lepidopterella palustris CBS 459.81 TaxID=1314670 RepID=A0A8E2DWR3_9PEZI|nr:hypothetical protein K432DRAFT_11936 [Lepidopterella palustris CBS 459.81]
MAAAPGGGIAGRTSPRPQEEASQEVVGERLRGLSIGPQAVAHSAVSPRNSGSRDASTHLPQPSDADMDGNITDTTPASAECGGRAGGEGGGGSGGVAMDAGGESDSAAVSSDDGCGGYSGEDSDATGEPYTTGSSDPVSTKVSPLRHSTKVADGQEGNREPEWSATSSFTALSTDTATRDPRARTVRDGEEGAARRSSPRSSNDPQPSAFIGLDAWLQEDATEDGVDWQQEAIIAVREAISPSCTCKQGSAAGEEDGCGLHHIACLIDEEIQRCAPRNQPMFPLSSRDTLLSREQCREMAPSVRWRALLTGIGLGQQTEGHSPPRLSLARSESEHLAATGPVDIIREFDIDSIIFEASSLAVHRRGFRFSLRPLFIHAIKQDQKVTIQGHELHKTKHICIGQGRLSGGFGYSCHVFFPNMPMVRRNEHSGTKTELTTFLNNDIYGIWIEQIVLPTLREVCGPGYLQHYPKTYDEILGKANVKQEILDPENSSGVINHQIVLPEHFLEAFWAGVQRRSQSVQNTESSDNIFKNLFLVVSAHDLKLDEKTTTPRRLKNGFLSHVQTIFRLEPRRCIGGTRPPMPPQEPAMQSGSRY